MVRLPGSQAQLPEITEDFADTKEVVTLVATVTAK